MNYSCDIIGQRQGETIIFGRKLYQLPKLPSLSTLFHVELMALRLIYCLRRIVQRIDSVSAGVHIYSKLIHIVIKASIKLMQTELGFGHQFGLIAVAYYPKVIWTSTICKITILSLLLLWPRLFLEFNIKCGAPYWSQQTVCHFWPI